MSTESLLLISIIALLMVVILLAGGFFFYRQKQTMAAPVKPRRNSKAVQTPVEEESEKIEFTKKLMIVLLVMWALGGVIGFWMVALLQTVEVLELAQNYVSYPVTAGIAMYGGKSCAENCKKIAASSNSVTPEVKVSEEGESVG